MAGSVNVYYFFPPSNDDSFFNVIPRMVNRVCRVLSFVGTCSYLLEDGGLVKVSVR